MRAVRLQLLHSLGMDPHTSIPHAPLHRYRTGVQPFDELLALLLGHTDSERWDYIIALLTM